MPSLTPHKDLEKIQQTLTQRIHHRGIVPGELKLTLKHATDTGELLMRNAAGLAQAAADHHRERTTTYLAQLSVLSSSVQVRLNAPASVLRCPVPSGLKPLTTLSDTVTQACRVGTQMMVLPITDLEKNLTGEQIDTDPLLTQLQDLQRQISITAELMQIDLPAKILEITDPS